MGVAPEKDGFDIGCRRAIEKSRQRLASATALR
jgi:hypothetical protein